MSHIPYWVKHMSWPACEKNLCKSLRWKQEQSYEWPCYPAARTDLTWICSTDFLYFPSSLSHSGAKSGWLLRHIWSDRTLPGTWAVPGCVQHYGGRGGDPAGETLKEKGKDKEREGRKEECWVYFNSWSLSVWYLKIACSYSFSIWEHIV